MNFEKKISRLEEIVQKMEKGEITLEESLQLFEEGVKLSRECQQDLTQAENHIQKLVGFSNDNQPLTENFINESNES